MTPEHEGFSPQTSIAPVQLLPHSIAIKSGQQMKISVRSVASNYTFKGLLIQARAEAPSREIFGNFAAPTDNSLKLMVCGGSYSTLVHADPTPKSNLLLVWKAPTNFRGFIRFQ
jgi:hypothetical protein